MSHSSRGHGRGSGRYQCDQCHRTYSRRDHLTRHMQLHTDRRSFTCEVCGRPFTRADLLLRHRSALHGGQDARPTGGAQWQRPSTRRVVKACSPCAAAKVKCCNERPCRRCLKQGISCPSAATAMASSSLHHRGAPAEETLAQTGSTATIESHEDMNTILATSSRADVGQYIRATPDSLRMEGYSVDPFADLLYEPFQLDNDWTVSPGEAHNNAQVDVMTLSDRKPKETLSSRWFDSQTRDQLLFTMADLAQTKPPQRVVTLRTRFPSVELLNELTERFFHRQERKLDSWIHSTTFQARDGNIELKAIIVASSALNTSSSALRQIGADVYGVVRPSILAKLDDDSKSPCERQLYQAFLLHLELELWHDEDESFSRAGRLANMIPRFLRRQARETRSDASNVPSWGDDPTDLDRKWSRWITSESYRRLTTRFCVYDNQLAMTLGTKTSTSISAYRWPSPQPKSLWLARSAADWRQVYLSHSHESTPQVTDLVSSLPQLTLAKGFVDQELTIKLVFHLLGGLIADHRLSSQVSAHRSMEKGPNSVREREKELKSAITNFDDAFRSQVYVPNIRLFIVSYLTMTLSVSIENIENLSGRAGHEESQGIFEAMKDWGKTAGAREAIWNAGEMLQLIKYLDHLTNFQIVMAYHAGLVLFAYSVLSRDQRQIPSEHGLPEVVINGREDDGVGAFIQHGLADPTLQGDFRGTECTSIPLHDTDNMIDIACEIILNRTCTCDNISPQLVNGIVKLLKGKLASVRPPSPKSPFLYDVDAPFGVMDHQWNELA